MNAYAQIHVDGFGRNIGKSGQNSVQNYRHSIRSLSIMRNYAAKHSISSITGAKKKTSLMCYCCVGIM
jgi:hypothetical protein